VLEGYFAGGSKEKIFAGGSKEWIFPGVAKKSCPEGPKVVKFHFALSKTRKQIFFAKMKRKISKSRGSRIPPASFRRPSHDWL